MSGLLQESGHLFQVWLQMTTLAGHEDRCWPRCLLNIVSWQSGDFQLDNCAGKWQTFYLTTISCIETGDLLLTAYLLQVILLLAQVIPGPTTIAAVHHWALSVDTVHEVTWWTVINMNIITLHIHINCFKLITLHSMFWITDINISVRVSVIRWGKLSTLHVCSASHHLMAQCQKSVTVLLLLQNVNF